MDLIQYANLVNQMRIEQTKYFRLKGVAPEVKIQQLEKSKNLERKVDRETANILKPSLGI
jgi:hypothetical protein